MSVRGLVYIRQALTDVASGRGFSDQCHFSQAFRRHFGHTPENIANIMPGGKTMPLLSQILPLPSKSRRVPRRYNPAVPSGESIDE
jgi:AraC-like DNA-binding protein